MQFSTEHSYEYFKISVINRIWNRFFLRERNFSIDRDPGSDHLILDLDFGSFGEAAQHEDVGYIQ